MLETKSEVDQFITLQKKNTTELKAICEGMKLETDGSREDLIDRLLTLDFIEQRPILVPQAIPLRTRNCNSQPLDAAINAMRYWRKLIFEAQGNRKEFQLLNSKGKPYSAKLRYIRCSSETLYQIIKGGWYLPLKHNQDLIELLLKETEKFEASIIQKPDGQGNSWLMLHVQPKAA